MKRVIPIMNDILENEGLVRDEVLVSGLEGPLEAGWEDKVEAFAARLPVQAA